MTIDGRDMSPARAAARRAKTGSAATGLETPALSARRTRGRAAYHLGRSAESAVARHYAGAGLAVIEARWRGAAGEIDLVLRDGEGVVFVEVKAARDHASAARSLTPRQVGRLLDAGAEYLGGCARGALTPARFDVALVDRTGRVEVIENALGQ